MNKTLISAYKFPGSYHSMWKGEEDYIKTSTVKNTPESVKKYITEYLERNDCNERVKSILQHILSNNKAKNIHIVWDGSYRNAVILVRPDSVFFTHRPEECESNEDIFQSIDWCIENCETLFLNMTDTTWAEEVEEMEMFDDYDLYERQEPREDEPEYDCENE
jgi:hypothetical protein